VILSKKTAELNAGRRGTSARRNRKEIDGDAQHPDDATTTHTPTAEHIYSLFLLGPPRTRPVLLAAMRPTFFPGGESRATVVA